MKRYIAQRVPGKRWLDGRELTPADAGRDFLATVLACAAADLNITADEEIALTVPVEAFEHYEDWLASVADAAGLPRFRLIDEPSAAALGYGAHVQAGAVYLVFDFGGGTLDVAVVLVEPEETAAVGRHCRVLGKAGMEMGGTTIDQWLFQEVLRRNRTSDAEDDVRALSIALLVECERTKQQLTYRERADVSVMHPDTGIVLSAEFTRSQFEELLDQHEAFASIDQTIRRALNAARERGYPEEHIKAVLMVGGSSLIPSVQRTVQRIFGRERVRHDCPLDAVARGAAAFVAGVDFDDHIQHAYAIRYVDSIQGVYDYRMIVPHGTPYPAQGSVAQLSIKAMYDGQTQLGIAIFEMGEPRRRSTGQPLELVFDPSGAARLTYLTPDEADRRTFFWMNEHSPTFLVADPPARQGEARFAVEFGVDGNKRLLITARDVRTGRVTHRDYPVVKLT
jgi:molecular chaperone DnaK (HSP70)